MDELLEELMNKIEIKRIQENEEFCKYVSKCNKLCFESDEKYCQIREFYDDHGENCEEEMFIGSKI